MPASANTLVFHRGALGDVILLWPLLRALRAVGHAVTLITDREKALLSADELGISGLDIEQPRFNALWSSPSPPPDPSISLVISSLAPPGSAWARNAAAIFPSARIDLIAAPLNRQSAIDLIHVYASGDREPTAVVSPVSPSAPLVVHVGAGSPSKRWPMPRWRELVLALQRSASITHPIQLIAGEVEADRFTADDRAIFSDLGGRWLTDLRSLASTIKSAALVIGADSGPMHLAAQLGCPTLTLFGPTDPALWAPIPRDASAPAHILAPTEPSPMTWLEPVRALEAIERAARTFSRP